MRKLLKLNILLVLIVLFVSMAIAPTVLALMGLPKPTEMTGESLVLG